MTQPPDTGAPPDVSEKPVSAAEAAKLAEQQARQKAQERAGDALVFLSQLRKGEFGIELADALEEVTRAVREHKKGGAVTVKLAISPMKNANDVVTVVDTVTVKAPRGERAASVRFTTADGELLVDPPSQYAAISREQLGGAR